jgi:hypothetical protein
MSVDQQISESDYSEAEGDPFVVWLLGHLAVVRLNKCLFISIHDSCIAVYEVFKRFSAPLSLPVHALI